MSQKLVAYFSATGRTAKVAKLLSETVAHLRRFAGRYSK